MDVLEYLQMSHSSFIRDVAREFRWEASLMLYFAFSGMLLMLVDTGNAVSVVYLALFGALTFIGFVELIGIFRWKPATSDGESYMSLSAAECIRSASYLLKYSLISFGLMLGAFGLVLLSMGLPGAWLGFVVQVLGAAMFINRGLGANRALAATAGDCSRADLFALEVIREIKWEATLAAYVSVLFAYAALQAFESSMSLLMPMFAVMFALALSVEVLRILKSTPGLPGDMRDTATEFVNGFISEYWLVFLLVSIFVVFGTLHATVLDPASGMLLSPIPVVCVRRLWVSRRAVSGRQQETSGS